MVTSHRNYFRGRTCRRLLNYEYAAGVECLLKGATDPGLRHYLCALEIDAMVLFRVIPLREVYAAIDGPILVMLAAIIPVSDSLRRTGATESSPDGSPKSAPLCRRSAR